MSYLHKKGVLRAICAMAFLMPSYQAVAVETERHVESVHKTGASYDNPAAQMQNANLVAAIIDRDMAEITQLLDAGANINADNGQPLRVAADTGYLDAVALLLDRGANPDLDDGFALTMAADNGHIDIVELLLARNINPFLEGIEMFLEQMQVVKKDFLYDVSKYSSPEYDEIVQMINDRRKELRPDYTPRIYDTEPINKRSQSGGDMSLSL